MKPRLKLEVCAFFVDEFRAALAAEKRDDIEIIPIQGACDERRPTATETPPALIEMPPLREPALSLMGICSGGATCQKSLHSCFELLLGPDKVEALLGEGAHLLTPAMVRAYPETLQSWNETPENLHAYFAESVRAWVVVDIGVSPLKAAEQAAFVSATGGTMELLPTEPHLLRANLRAALAQGETAAISARSAGQLASLQHRLADYTMAYDLISRLIPQQGEQTIVHAMLELFYMLCAPRAVHLLLVQDVGTDGDANAAEGSVQLFSLPADSGKEDQIRKFLCCPTPCGEIGAPRGFYFQIHQDEQALGAVVVEGAFLPEHQRNYLDIAHLLMPILRLALHNARSYEKLCNAERELRASHTKLEQRVEERTVQLKESLDRLNKIASQVPGVVFQFRLHPDGSSCVPYASEGIREIYRISQEDVREDASPVFAIVHPDDLPGHLASIQASAKNLTPWSNEYRLKFEGEPDTWLLGNAIPQREADGSVLWHGLITDITGRKQAEEMLRLHSAILGNLAEGIYLIRISDGVIVFTNPQFERMFGYEPGELLGKHVSIVNAPSKKSPETTATEIISELVQTGVWEGEVQNVRKDGTAFWCHANVTRLDHPQYGQVLVAVHEDITERKKAESALRKERDFIKAIFDTAGTLIVVLDRKGHIVRLNKIGEAITGYRFEEICEQPFWDIFLLENERAGVAAVFDRITAGDIVSRYENHWHCKDGSARLFDWYNTVLLDDKGDVEYLVGIANDITERKLAEKKLRNTNQLLDSIIENIPNMVFLKSASELRFELFNRAGEVLLGHVRDDLLGRNDYDFFPKEQADFFTAKDRATLKQNGIVDIPEEPIETPHGTRILHTKKLVLRDEQGQPQYLLGISEDITERKLVADALRESERRYRSLVENSPLCIHEIGMDGRLISMNKSGLLMMGIKDESAVRGHLYLDAVNDADRERIGELLAKAYAGETSHFEFKSSGPREQIFKSCFVPVMNNEGGVEKLMGITEDITERKKSEEQIHSLAFYDTLTQLPNRRLLNDRLEQTMASSKRSSRYGALMFLDLDNFKPLNDTHGHDVGDLLLIKAAYRIISCVRETDTVARFGGDEFVVMLSELDVDKAESLAQAGIVAEKIRATLAEPYMLIRKQEGNAEATIEHHCTSSIGVVLFINHEASTEDILKWADMAMYQAKEGGRNQIRFYDR